MSKQRYGNFLTRSTAWEAVIHTAHRIFGGETTIFSQEVVASLFELMLSHREDPHASYACKGAECCGRYNEDTVSVNSIVLQYLNSCPEECRRLLELLEAMKRQPLSSNTRITSRLKNKLKFRR
jgi:hypothetical protein